MVTDGVPRSQDAAGLEGIGKEGDGEQCGLFLQEEGLRRQLQLPGVEWR